MREWEEERVSEGEYVLRRKERERERKGDVIKPSDE